jgi:hypothetical protein
MTQVKALSGKWMQDPKFKAEYDRLGPVYELVGARVEAPFERWIVSLFRKISNM